MPSEQEFDSPNLGARRVVVSGVGSIAPVGVGKLALWDAIARGESGISRITRFDAADLPCRVAGQVAESQIAEFVDSRTLRTAPLVSQLAIAAVRMALDDARVGRAAFAPERIGVVVGTALAGWADAEKQVGVLLERGARRINPFVVSGAGGHGPGAEVAAVAGARGPQLTISNGCPSSLDAIKLGASFVKSGTLDLCLAGGAEAPLSPSVFSALCRTHELCIFDGDPQYASRPFDRRHAGIVLSEGSCFLILEEARAAAARGATAYAEVLGGDSSCDASGLYMLDQSGEVAAGSIQQSLARYKMPIDFVCSHANSSVSFDTKESRVLMRALGARSTEIPVSSIKGVLGHPFGASGAFQTATAALALWKQIVPPNTNLDEVAQECKLSNLPTTAREASLRTALVTAYGYGGMNSCLILAAADDTPGGHRDRVETRLQSARGERGRVWDASVPFSERRG